MDYEQFREQLAEEVQKNLYEKGDVDVNITFNHVEKAKSGSAGCRRYDKTDVFTCGRRRRHMERSVAY